MRRLRLVGVLLALFVGVAHAIVLDDMIDGARQTDGTLVSAKTTTGVTSTSVCTGVRSGPSTPTLDQPQTCRGGYYRSIVFTYCSDAGTATVGLEVNCAGAGWVPVANSSKSIGVGCDGASILYPQCSYRASVTACAGCNVTASYDAGQAVK